MRRDAFRLSRRHQAWLYTSFGVLFLSGVLWLIFHYQIRVQGEFGETTHPLESWTLKAHGAAAMVVLVLLGTLVPGHIRRAWNAGKNRLTGAGLIGLNALLIFSGYGLYYLGGEDSRTILSAAHWLLGLVFPAALAWHIWRGRRERHLNVPPRPDKIFRSGGHSNRGRPK